MARNNTNTENIVDGVNTATGEVVGTDIVGIDDETAAAGALDIAGILESMNDSSKVVTTIQGEDFDARLQLAAALTTSEPVDDHLDEVIQLVDFVAHEVSFVAKDTNKLVDSVRTVLIDEDGKAYHATSVGLLTSLRNLRLALGPVWGQKPVPVKLKRTKGNNGFYFFTLNVVR